MYLEDPKADWMKASLFINYYLKYTDWPFLFDVIQFRFYAMNILS